MIGKPNAQSWLWVVIVLMLPPALAPQSASGDLCGMTILSNVKLDQDLTCDGDGLIVGADGITIDLNGHSISGGEVGVGITVRARRGVAIHGGTVRRFVTGVFLAGSTGVVVKANRFTENREAVFLSGSSQNVVKENVAWQNQSRGIMIRPNASGLISTQNLVVENTLTDNPVGILLFGQPGNILKENVIAGSAVAGVHLTGGGASGNLLKENLVTSSAAGIRFELGWTKNTVVENMLQANTCGIEGTTVGNTFKENVFTANASDLCG